MDGKALNKLTYGLFLLTAQEAGKDNGCIINTAVQVAGEPTRISVSVINGNLTCEQIRRTGVFNVSALTAETPFSTFSRFGMQSGRTVDKFAGFSAAARSENGLYYLADANMYLSARVVESLDLGSHTLFIAEVTDGRTLSDAPSCTYDFYRSSIRPKPDAAPQKKTWVCSVCGYVYEGDELPEGYICPTCKHDASAFEKLE